MRKTHTPTEPLASRNPPPEDGYSHALIVSLLAGILILLGLTVTQDDYDRAVRYEGRASLVPPTGTVPLVSYGAAISELRECEGDKVSMAAQGRQLLEATKEAR